MVIAICVVVFLLVFKTDEHKHLGGSNNFLFLTCNSGVLALATTTRIIEVSIGITIGVLVQQIIKPIEYAEQTKTNLRRKKKKK